MIQLAVKRRLSSSFYFQLRLFHVLARRKTDEILDNIRNKLNNICLIERISRFFVLCRDWFYLKRTIMSISMSLLLMLLVRFCHVIFPTHTEFMRPDISIYYLYVVCISIARLYFSPFSFSCRFLFVLVCCDCSVARRLLRQSRHILFHSESRPIYIRIFIAMP